MLRTRIGVMVPSTNTTLGGDLARVPPPAVTLHSHRLWMTNDANDDEAFAQVNDAIETAARYLGTARRDVVAYGCTRRLEAPAGREMPALMCAAAGAPAVATSLAVVEALRVFHARRISVVTPYPQWNNRRLRPYFERAGFEVLNGDGEPAAAASGNQSINDQEP